LNLFWDSSSCPCYYRYHFCFYIPHTLCFYNVYFKIFSAALSLYYYYHHHHHHQHYCYYFSFILRSCFTCINVTAITRKDPYSPLQFEMRHFVILKMKQEQCNVCLSTISMYNPLRFHDWPT
jgi:hypothetical protein